MESVCWCFVNFDCEPWEEDDDDDDDYYYDEDEAEAEAEEDDEEDDDDDDGWWLLVDSPWWLLAYTHICEAVESIWSICLWPKAFAVFSGPDDFQARGIFRNHHGANSCFTRLASPKIIRRTCEAESQLQMIYKPSLNLKIQSV